MAGFLGFCAPAVQLSCLHLHMIWTFIASFPQHKPHFIRRRIPKAVQEDLLWWRDLLPLWNGILFFDNSTRSNISLFTDASCFGLGGFFITGTIDGTESIDYSEIPDTNVFAMPIIMQEGILDINIHEIEAIHCAFLIWGPYWSKKMVKVFIDNTIYQRGLQKQTLYEAAFKPL